MRFSQIELSLGENLCRHNLLKILAEIIWCNLFSEFGPRILPQNWFLTDIIMSITDIIMSK